jgi:hypothetical protein
MCAPRSIRPMLDEPSCRVSVSCPMACDLTIPLADWRSPHRTLPSSTIAQKYEQSASQHVSPRQIVAFRNSPSV